jgi:uncharacterized protein (TIGR02118 family)
MVKLFALFLKLEPPEDFTQHVETVLLPLLKQVQDLRHLAVTRIDGAPLGEAKYSLVVELGFENRKAMDAALASKEGKAVARDILKFAGDRVTLMIGDSLV